MCTEFNGLIAFPLKCFILNLWINKTAESLPHNLTFICSLQSPVLIYKTSFCARSHVAVLFSEGLVGNGRGIFTFLYVHLIFCFVLALVVNSLKATICHYLYLWRNVEENLAHNRYMIIAF